MEYENKIKIGVSHSAYRYNRSDFLKKSGFITDIFREKELFSLHVFYPVMKREFSKSPRLIRSESSIYPKFWINNAEVYLNGKGIKSTKIKNSIDVMIKRVRKENIRVFVYMANGERCVAGNGLKKSSELLKRKLLEEGVFLISVQDLKNPIKLWDIRRRMLAFVWVDDFEITNKKNIYEVWHQIKFICQEVDEIRARNFGKELANLPEILTVEEITDIKDSFLDILKTTSSNKKILQWMWKNYSFFRKKYGFVVDGIEDPLTPRNPIILAKELSRLEMEFYNKGFSFGSSPIFVKENER